jgi:hypothetical protein
MRQIARTLAIWRMHSLWLYFLWDFITFNARETQRAANLSAGRKWLIKRESMVVTLSNSKRCHVYV